MRRSVSAAFFDVNRRSEFEGYVPHFYADVKGLVTIGVGNLCDPLSSALTLPMRRSDDSLATAEEIRADWRAVKTDPLMAKEGWKRAARVCKLHLSENDIRTLVHRRVCEMAGDLRGQFADFDTWPADAEFGLLSLSWARGSHWYESAYPRMTATLRARDFFAASKECGLAGGYKARNALNRACFRSAARVEAEGLDPEELHYEDEMHSEA